MTLPAGMVGDGQPDWGEDGCDSLDDPREGEGKWEGRKRCYQRVDKAPFLLQSYAATCIKNCDQTLLGRLSLWSSTANSLPSQFISSESSSEGL